MSTQLKLTQNRKRVPDYEIELEGMDTGTFFMYFTLEVFDNGDEGYEVRMFGVDVTDEVPLDKVHEYIEASKL